MMIKMAKICETMWNLKTMRKIKSPLMICADVKSILVTENNGNQNPNETYTNIKVMLAVVFVINYYVLMINLASHI